MAIPSNIGSLPTTPAVALNGIITLAGVLKAETLRVRASSAAGTVSSQDILNYSTLAADLLDQFDTYAAVPSLSTYAQSQTGNANIAADYATMRAAIVAARDWIVTNFPKSAGYLLASQIAASGRQTLRIFTAAETAGLRTLLDTITTTID
jgi:hypothetical protein